MDGEKSNDMFVRFDHSHIISTAHAVFPVTGFVARQLSENKSSASAEMAAQCCPSRVAAL